VTFIEHPLGVNKAIIWPRPGKLVVLNQFFFKSLHYLQLCKKLTSDFEFMIVPGFNFHAFCKGRNILVLQYVISEATIKSRVICVLNHEFEKLLTGFKVRMKVRIGKSLKKKYRKDNSHYCICDSKKHAVEQDCAFVRNRIVGERS
jgi:hypothetical protein